MNLDDRFYLLKIARSAILSKIEGVDFIAGRIPDALKQLGCCFVTLTKDKEVRGSVGHLEAFEPLYMNVMRNAVSAAFNDSRFSPLTKSDLEKVEIEISVLSKPERLIYLTPEDLLKKLVPDKGVIFKKGNYQSTFLPQVWNMIPDRTEFLENLSIKAGLNGRAWLEGPEIFLYDVIKINE